MHSTSPRFEAVLFDLDGTLVDSETTAIDVFHEEGTALGLSFSREEAFRAFRGQPMSHCVAYIAERLPQPVLTFGEGFSTGFTAHIRRRQAKRFRQNLPPMPGARELLQALELPFCVATNGPREKAELTLGLTGLLPFFDQRLFCAYEVGSFKPEPGLCTTVGPSAKNLVWDSALRSAGHIGEKSAWGGVR